MDITSKYRTKCPPKEHEEAVRMLLEGIKNTKQDSTTTTKDMKEVHSSSNYDYEDGRSVQSFEVAGSVSSCENNLNKRHLVAANSSDSSSGIDHDALYREPIPSRTIAVQCDLKSSSVRRGLLPGEGGELTIDGSMQASSISSTRYGYYNFTPETLEQRRKLQRSVSNRDLAPQSQNQIEAPTSMSELSLSDNDVDNQRQQYISKSYRDLHNDRTLNNSKNKFTTSSSSYSSSSHQSYVHQDSRSKTASALNKGWTRPRQQSGQIVDDDSSTARAKINSLPRRPMTALSYVSATKLRNDHQQQQQRQNFNQSPNRYLSDERGGRSDEVQRARSIKNRTMSQQTLTRPRTSAPEFELKSSCSGSDSELDNALVSSRFRKSRYDATNIQQATRRHVKEDIAPSIVSSNLSKNEVSPVKPPRPTLVSSKHEEQVLDYKTLERNPSQVRPTVLQDLTSNNNNNNNTYKYSSQGQINRGGAHEKFATIERSVHNDDRLSRDSYESAEYSSRLRSQQRQPVMQSAAKEEYQTVRNYGQHNSMSLSRRPIRTTGNQEIDYRARNVAAPEVVAGNGYYTASRIKPHKLSRNDRAYSQTHLPKPLSSATYNDSAPDHMETMTRRVVKPNQTNFTPAAAAVADVSRSMSMRQINRLAADRYDVENYATPVQVGGGRVQDPIENYHVPLNHDDADHHRQEIAFKKRVLESSASGRGRDYTTAADSQDLYLHHNRESDEGDSESPLTKTWTNPSAVLRQTPQQFNESHTLNNRKSSRSYSMRDVNNPLDYNGSSTQQHNRFVEDYHTKLRKQDISSYNSSSESSSLENAQQRFAARQQQQTLDYNSQHRLNEIGLPEVNPMTQQANRRPEQASGSYLGITGSYRDSAGLYTSQRAPQITGRALSQQSLTRPTMPLMSSRRRAGGSNHSGSDVGGSSMSLVSRLHGRYENAHTRTPVVMYIPKAMPRSNSHSGGVDGSASLIGKSSTLRKSSRTRQKSSSQDRSRRSLSRNGSDSESSSMLRTLVRPRSRLQGSNYSSKRAARHMHSVMHDDEDEDIDGIGQLASEMDSYKFRRRYSVPKDAKINWFAKLKQRVSSSGNK